MERRFHITMLAPLGKRHGIMSFTEAGGSIRGTMELLGCKNTFTGKSADDGILELSGKMTSGLDSFTYLAKGVITESGKLTLNVAGDRYSFCIMGVEVKSEEEEKNELY